MTQLRLRRQPRRGREWFHKSLNFSMAPATVTAIILDVGMVLDEKKDSTVVREMINFLQIANAVSSLSNMAYGICFMNADAHAALAFPTPGDDFVEDTDWLWLLPTSIDSRPASGGGPAGLRIKEDIHTKRKYTDRNELLVFVAQNLSGTIATSVQGFVRMLILDPP